MPKRKTKKDELIERINKEFKDQLPCIIPKDQPIATHTKKEVKRIQCLSWYFIPKFNFNATAEEDAIDEKASLIGSDFTIKELLESDGWILVPDKEGDQFPEGSMKIKLSAN